MKQMKKSVCVLLAFTFCMGMSPLFARAVAPFAPGDVSGDGQITAEDARLALRTAVGLEQYEADSAEFLAADAAKDGAVTAEDARLILRAAVGLEKLPDDGGPVDPRTEEIAAMLTEAINATRSDLRNVTVQHEETFSEMTITKCPGGSIGVQLANHVASAVLKPSNETLIYADGSAVNADGETVPLLLPEKGEFKLPAAGIKTADAHAVGDKTVITVVLVEEHVSRREAPLYNAGAIGYLEADDLDLSLLTIDRVDITYPRSVIKAVIGADGYVEEITYEIPIEIDAEGSAFGISGNFACSGTQKEIWTVDR